MLLKNSKDQSVLYYCTDCLKRYRGKGLRALDVLYTALKSRPNGKFGINERRNSNRNENELTASKANT